MIDAIVIILIMLISSLAISSIIKNRHSCNGNCSDCGACKIDFDKIKREIKKV